MKSLLALAAFLMTVACMTAQQPGQSGVIKVRKSGSQHFFVDIEEPAICRQLNPKRVIADFKLDCSDCPEDGGLVWLKVITSTQGQVEDVKVEKAGDPEIDSQAMTFARTLTFEPYLIEGKKRSVRFLFPVRYYLP